MKLNVPQNGFGTYRLKGKRCIEAVYNAIECGYRLIDTARIYDNEKEIGKAISISSVPRESIFITSKLWFPYNNVKEAILKSCKNLNTGYIDCYLVHKPNSIFPKEHLIAFEELEKCRQEGLIHAIGVTSFNLGELEELVNETGIIPDLVQEECHPFFQRKYLQQKIEHMGSIFQAWYPLGGGDIKLFNEHTLRKIAYEHGITVPLLILMWHLQEGHSFVVRSTNIEHIKSNLKVQGDMLSNMEMKQIRSLDCNKSYAPLPNWAQTIFFKSPFGHLV